MLKRHISKKLEKYIQLFPVTLVIGAHQSGKTTLAGKKNGYTYYTFDDPSSFANAKEDPASFIEFIQKPAILDEVQRGAEIFLPIKYDVDQNRKKGRYLLTGSANPLLLPKCGDSLAGRMGILTLYPFSQAELLQKKSHFLEALFGEGFAPRQLDPIEKETWAQILTRGSFPPTITLDSEADVQIWIESYLRSMMDRDIRDLANISGITEFPRLLRLLAYRSASLLNFSEVSRTLGMANVTLNRYVRLLETLFFVHFLPAWYTNHGKRLTKTPKIHLCDTSFLAHLLDVNSEKLLKDPSLLGQFLETFVFTELQKLQSVSEVRFNLFHFRDGTKEVDFVIERSANEIYGIEVKSSSSVANADLKGLKHLRESSNGKFKKGLILHTGKRIEQMSEDIWAVPIQALWQI